MNILVTGSSGTIGTRLCEQLMAAGHDIVGADWLPNEWQPSVQEKTIIADLRKSEEWEKLPTNIDVCIHLAANARVYELVVEPDRACDNVLSLFHALEFCRKHRIKKFLFASSRESYGNIEVESYREDLVRVENCESPYTASKIAGEAFTEAYTRCYGIDHIIFRFSNVYGMYDNSVRVVPLFIRRARKNEPLTIYGQEKCLDFTYIDDCVDGIMLALTKFNAAKNETYNLAYGQGTTILRLAERVKELLKSSSEITIGERRTGEISRYIADITKAKNTFGYDPQTPFERGIEKAVEWYLAHPEGL